MEDVKKTIDNVEMGKASAVADALSKDLKQRAQDAIDNQRTNINDVYSKAE